MAWKKEYGQNRYKRHREKILEESRKRYAANPEKDRDKHLKRLYGIGIEEYNSILELQGGVCKICGGAPDGPQGKKGSYCVDHDHQTGKVRGLLCSSCNTGLGGFKDNPELLAKAILYLE